MLDSHIRPILERALASLADRLVVLGMSANTLTALALCSGLAAATAIATGVPMAGAVLFLAGRLLDGLDGPVARRTATTDLGGYLDIVFDFLVYAAIPLAFALHNPTANALPAAALLAAIIANASAFLAFAVMAERHSLVTAAQGRKSLFFLAGLAEGAETVLVYTAVCIWPVLFPSLATGFAILCVASAVGRVVIAIRLLGSR